MGTIVNFKKTYVFLFLLTFFNFGVLFADDYTGNEMVRIGLNFNIKNADRINISSQSDLSIFEMSKNREGIKLFDINSNDATIEKGTMSRVNLIYNQRFSSFYDIEEQLSQIHQNNPNSFYYFDDGWYLVLGRYNSTDSAYSNRANIVGVNSDSMDIMFTKSDDVYFITSKIVFGYSSKNSDFFIASSDYPNDGIVTYNSKRYRGGFGAARSSSNDMAVINYLMMNHYLYGVVPKEMSGAWELEALKAQSVVARNYALTSLNSHRNEGYDLCDNTHCQVYGGYEAEAANSNMAVDETIGELLYYDDELVVGYYHANSGGVTADISNVWGDEKPYLKSVYDPFSIGKPRSDWELTMSKQYIEDKLYQHGYNIGSLQSVQIVDVSDDKRVQRIDFIGTNGTASVKKEKMRKIFGYVEFKSIYYDIDSNTPLYVANTSEVSRITLSSSSAYDGNKVVKVNPSRAYIQGVNGKRSLNFSSDKYKFVGHGFGHGIGMSQWGAKAMAEQGYSYKDILYHYYTDTHLE